MSSWLGGHRSSLVSAIYDQDSSLETAMATLTLRAGDGAALTMSKSFKVVSSSSLTIVGVRPRLPNELLSEIVKHALAITPLVKELDATGTNCDGADDKSESSASTSVDEDSEDNPRLFTAKKAKLAILHGMLMASRLMREIVLKEWFHVLRVSVNDWEYLSHSLHFDVFSNTRDVYCRDYGMKSIEYMGRLQTLRSASFPVGPDFNCLLSFPRTLEVLECRDVDIVTAPLLEAVADTMPHLLSLRIDCGEDGPYQPIPSEGKSGKDIGMEYAGILKTLNRLRILSLDVSLAPTGFSEGHDDECSFKCEGCWNAKQVESETNEREASVAIAMMLPNIKVVEWACWIRQPSEMKNRLSIVRKGEENVAEGLDVRTERVLYQMYPAC